MREIALQGARVWRVNGLIHECGKIVREGVDPNGWFDVSGNEVVGLSIIYNISCALGIKGLLERIFEQLL